MKLIFDNNLSPSLVRSLIPDFPNSIHCTDARLDNSDDVAVWNFAKQNDFTIITKDSDFNAIVTLRGFPPRIVWIRRGNCSTKEIEKLIRHNIPLMNSFADNESEGLLILF